MRNKQVLLASRPQGQVQESNFRLVESEIPAPREGQVLARAPGFGSGGPSALVPGDDGEDL